MAKEIERKFLIKTDDYRRMAVSKRHIIQGYMSRRPESTVRVRICDNRGYLTIKGITQGCVRDEWEYAIPVDDARGMLACCEGRVIDKTRYCVDFGGYTWEIDEFSGDLASLVLAEIELPSEDATFPIPSFIGEEVTGNPAYYNSRL